MYRAELPEVMAAQSIAEHRATSGRPVEDLLLSLRREHLRLSAGLDGFGAQRVFLARAKALPEYGGACFFASYARLPADNGGDSRGSKSAPETPAWAEALTAGQAAAAPAPLPVLVCMNALGVHIRPLPPWHTPSTSYAYAASTPVSAGGSKAAAALSHQLTPSETLSPDGRPVPWTLHP